MNPSSTPDKPDSHSITLRTILIVDDEAIIRELCCKALGGYRILQARDGEEALKIFERENVDVILSDIMMPKMNGLELLKRVKEIAPTQVVVVMTGYAEKEVILNALKSDADDFITKPLNLIQLKTSVDKALEKKSLKEEIANLQSLDRLKTNFLSLVSHKFRTPITTISLFLQNMAGGVYDLDDPLFQKNLHLIFEESCYLEQLVANLLAFTQIMDKGEALKREPIDVKTLLYQLASESPEVVKRPGIETTFNLEKVPPLPLDRFRITFALKQILDNAYKFTQSPGKVSISLSTKDDDISITISDTGIGIGKADLAKIFEKFYQVDIHQTGQVRGFGLGLFYAREFIHRHGGRILVSSEIGKGTKVTVTLPVIEEPSALSQHA